MGDRATMTGTRRVSDLSASSRWSWRCQWHGRGLQWRVLMQHQLCQNEGIGSAQGALFRRYAYLCWLCGFGVRC